MRGIRKFVLISVGGVLVFMVLGMVLGIIFEVKPDEVKAIDPVGEWMWYRIAFYVLIVALWPFGCKWIATRGKNTTGEKWGKTLTEDQDRIISYFQSQWWKIALLMFFLELIVIQQLGLDKPW